MIDGFGCRGETEFNAIAQADTPRFDRLFRESSWTTLEASGAPSVCRAIRWATPKSDISTSAPDGSSIRTSSASAKPSRAMSWRRIRHSSMSSSTAARFTSSGLLSDGGVHSMQTHLHGLIDAAIALGAKDVFVHAILDGRDTPPKSAEKYLGDLIAHIDGKPQAHLATIIGRYFTMDRDKRWDRVQRGYDLMTLGVGTETKDPIETLRRFYEQGVTDEFIEPISVLTAEGAHLGRIEDGDAVVFFNFRADRMRQIVTAFKDDDFDGFHRAVRPKIHIATMNSYREDWTLPVLFPPQEVKNHLGEVLSQSGPETAPHRRDRKIRARHVLLQRRLRRDSRQARSAFSSPRRRWRRTI